MRPVVTGTIHFTKGVVNGTVAGLLHLSKRTILQNSCDFQDLFGNNNNNNNTPDAEPLERGSLWLMEFLLDVADVSQGKSSKKKRIRQLLQRDLDRLARMISQLAVPKQWRSDDQHNNNNNKNGVTKSTTTTTALLDASMVILEDLGFIGNSQDYYNEQNSSLQHVLQKRHGIPITLAVVYKLLLYRLGFSVDIIGLPGHVVLGLGSEKFLDVFNGEILSLSDCQDIAARYMVTWDATFLQPMDAKAVLSRMMRNVLNCRAMTYNSRESVENMDSLMKMRDLLEFCQAVCRTESSTTTISGSSSMEVPKPRDFLFDSRTFAFFDTTSSSSSLHRAGHLQHHGHSRMASF